MIPRNAENVKRPEPHLVYKELIEGRTIISIAPDHADKIPVHLRE